MIMAGSIPRTARLSQELQLKDLLVKEVAMKYEVQQRRFDPDCCQAELGMLWSSWMQKITGQSGVHGVFLFCLFLKGEKKKKAYLDNSWKGPDEAAAGLQLLGCKYQATNYFQLLVTVIANGIN